jgi:CheY-like chemotaxis protein
LVEDEADVREMMADALRLTGEHTIAFAEDGTRGLGRLRAAPYDLVVTDIGLPDMSGLEMIDRAKLEGLLDRTPIVVSSANHWLKPQALQRGARFLRKPVDVDAVRAAVDAVRARLAATEQGSGSHESWRNVVVAPPWARRGS